MIAKGCVNYMNTSENKHRESTSLGIIAKDRTGLVNEISKIIADLNITILHHNARVYNNRNKGLVSDFKVDVKADNSDQIDILIRRLNKVKGVICVY